METSVEDPHPQNTPDSPSPSSATSSTQDGMVTAVGQESGGVVKPKKAAYRQRAHCNPLADSYIVYPRSPDFVDWSFHFPAFFPSEADACASRDLTLNTEQYPVSYPSRQPPHLNGTVGPRVEFLDVGCGFGGLLVSLAPKFPRTLMMGMEIREKVTNYVGERIAALRKEHAATGQFANVSIIRTNVMKFLVNYFRKGQLTKMFFCFPDPHFKRSNWRRRIINAPVLSLYAYVLRPGGLLYTVTDVEDLHRWMRKSCLLHPLFEEVPLTDLEDDPCLAAIESDTEEGMKVKRMGQPCYTCVFRRIGELPVA
ncbi:putative tRNA(guanine-N(7)-)-methyltransferase [Neospora caninum Liverpool]|uniref:tRNA (guanine-N(7)-)-methyltransferase n=1 Tax=Neospora caninum (strain Liverpool) TaxID=572307 RepID=F0V7A7_NEOCL|nr:putative tRNA(guanine-N(7)-)-methyltransferase [Neospora caninum Liverpool]CBZ49598.1 putative tRNA(guanine-N(7)-)-methyltransferase [Neospora caninum Liverpool]CEL64178.1 TPA: tRNA (guanine-N(7)-)-methyltransferase, putative [Neospora caninum Liverpool]|eukprot:XP_003879633.1 putative tRNA(guanine-N(7)-)-methyltransferase [Neospora caninum Liverpool]